MTSFRIVREIAERNSQRERDEFETIYDVSKIDAKLIMQISEMLASREHTWSLYGSTFCKELAWGDTRFNGLSNHEKIIAFLYISKEFIRPDADSGHQYVPKHAIEELNEFRLLALIHSVYRR